MYIYIIETSVYLRTLTVQVFDDLQLEAYDLNVDNLDVHAVRIVHKCNQTYKEIAMHIIS